jgi:hypothetical protein
VRRPTRDDTTYRACCEVAAGVQLDLLLGLQLAEFVCHCVVCKASIARYRGVVGLIMTSRAACGASRSHRDKAERTRGIKSAGSRDRQGSRRVQVYIQSTMTVELRVHILTLRNFRCLL